MLTPATSSNFFGQTEGQTLDFKQDPYASQQRRRPRALIRMFYRMPIRSTGPAHIVLGFKAHADDRKDLVGLARNWTTMNTKCGQIEGSSCPTFLYVPNPA